MSEEVKLPPLPESAVWSGPPVPPPSLPVVDWGRGLPAFTAAEMREYATAAVLAERERCAKLCEDFQVHTLMRNSERVLEPFVKESGGRHDGQAYAAAIRKG